MATLAANLDRARTAVRAAFPGTTVYWIGDAAHAAERSDHNPDARGIVHAIDVMLPAGDERAQAVVHAAIGRPDLEYVIHNHQIWSRNSGWQPRPYNGSNPHTDHVHLSGKHGTVGGTSSTESGYDVAAEHDTTPWKLALPEAIMSDADIPETHHAAENADRWGLAAVTGQPAHFLGSDGKEQQTTNTLHDKLDAIVSAVKTPAPVTLTDAQLATIAAQLGGKLDQVLAHLAAAGKALES